MGGCRRRRGARVGYLAEGHPVYGWMRVKDAEAYQSRFYPKWNADLFHSVLKFFRVDPKTRARHLSRGERAGLCLAMTLAPEPDLLILDDPAIGLDPVARRSLLESMVFASRKADRTIVFSSHLLADIERMADHIAVLDYSVLRAQCSLDTFRSCVQCYVLEFAGRPPELPAIRGLIQAVPRGNQLRLTLVNVTQETLAVLRELGPVEMQAAANQPGGCICQLPGREFGKRAAGRGAARGGDWWRCAMMGVFLRELRENAKWAAVICGVLLVLCVHEIRNPSPVLLYELANQTTPVMGALAGLLMGLVQSLFEMKADNWGFTVHRPGVAAADFCGEMCGGAGVVVWGAAVAVCVCHGVGGAAGEFADALSVAVGAADADGRAGVGGLLFCGDGVDAAAGAVAGDAADAGGLLGAFGSARPSSSSFRISGRPRCCWRWCRRLGRWRRGEFLRAMVKWRKGDGHARRWAR